MSRMFNSDTLELCNWPGVYLIKLWSRFSPFLIELILEGLNLSLLLGLTWQHVDLTSLWSWYRVVDTVAFQWKEFLVHFEKFIIYTYDHAITYIYGRRCNSAERGFREYTTCTCKKPFILLKLKFMLRSCLGVLIMLHFKFRRLILQKMFTVPKICIHFLRIFFHATPKIRTYHITKKIIIFKCSGIWTNS